MKKQLNLKNVTRSTVLVCCIMLLNASCGDDKEDILNNVPTIEDQVFTASEAIDNMTIIGQVVATDDDNDELTFSIKTNSNDLFEISDNGKIGLASDKELDFETAEFHNLSIDVSDGKDMASANITINVMDVNENQPPIFMAQTFSAPENETPRGGLIATLVASDPDNDALSFSWDPAGTVTAFELNTTTGEIRTVTNDQGDLNFETTPQYVVSVVASDGQLSTQADITINITDTNDTPVADDQSFTVAEDINGSALIGQIAATDEDQDALTFSVDIDNDSKFTLSSSGELSLRQNQNLDFETATSHQISVIISDGKESITSTITVNVTDVVESEYTVFTLAGSTQGNTDGTGSAAQFNTPRGIIALNNDDFLVVDSGNKAIKRVTSSGVVSTVVSSNQFGSLRDIVMDDDSNIYLSDVAKHVIWKLVPDFSYPPTVSYIRSVFAGLENESGLANGNGNNARFNKPAGLAIDADDNIYVADGGNNTVRKITPDRDVTTLISPGRALRPEDIALTPGGSVYFSDYEANVIGVVKSNGTINIEMGTFNGPGFRDGDKGTGLLNGPTGIMINGTDIYLVSNLNNAIRKISTSGANNELTTIANVIGAPAGDADGNGSEARFRNPIDIAIDSFGNLLITDTNNHKIKKITVQ